MGHFGIARREKTMGAQTDDLGSPSNQPTQTVLGYLNFSSGAADPQFLDALDVVFAEASSASGEQPIWRRVWEKLRKALSELEKQSGAFADAAQAKRVIDCMLDFCPAYHAYHAEQLAHQSEEALFNSFFTGRVAEVLLKTLNQ